MNRLIIAGSPRVNGRTGALAHLLFETCIEECPEDELAWVPVSEVSVGGCVGCGYCDQWAEALMSGQPLVFEDEEAAEDEAQTQASAEEDALPEEYARCSQDDDMLDVYELIDDAEELTIVSPVYFAGPPSQLKALLDRLQPYYSLNIAQGAGVGVPKRPAILHVVGEGGDPHGFDALVTIVKSAVACAGFELETVYDWVGKIDEEGEIQEEARVINLRDQPEPAAQAEALPQQPARAQLHLDDRQVQQTGKQSADQGRRPRSSGKTEKRQGKGGAQTNNRNRRKDNQNKHASDGRNTGPKTQSGRRQASGSQGQKRSGGANASKGGKRRG